jgi:hypothetical protein
MEYIPEVVIDPAYHYKCILPKYCEGYIYMCMTIIITSVDSGIKYIKAVCYIFFFFL